MCLTKRSSMSRRIDLTDRQFGDLQVLSYLGYAAGKSRYQVVCRCGRKQVTPYQDLVTHKTTRCAYCHARDKAQRLSDLSHQRRTQGCLPSQRRVEFGPYGLYKPGGPLRRLYNSLDSMIRRCYSPRHKAFRDYGAKGVSVCDAWLYSFPQFVADVGARPEGTTLDRYPNPAGNYVPGNVRWATGTEQRLNRRPAGKQVQIMQSVKLAA